MACMDVQGTHVRDESIRILGQPLHELPGCGGIRIVLHAPAYQFDQHRQEIERLFSRLVEDAFGLVRIAPPRDHFRGFEQPESAREYVRRYAFVAGQQFLEVAPAHHDDVAEHHQRPLVADEVQRSGYRAIGSPRRQ